MLTAVGILCRGAVLGLSRGFLQRGMVKDTPQQRDTMLHRQRRMKVNEQTLRILEAVIDVAIKIVPGAEKRDLNILSVLMQGTTIKRTAAEFDLTLDEILERAENALHSLELLQDRLTEEVNIAKSLKEYKRRYEDMLAAEKEKYKQELRTANAEKRKIQDDVVAIILDVNRRKKFLMQIPVHQLPVSSMLQSLLLNAGYDTLGDVLNRPLQQLSRNVATNRIYTKELKGFLRTVGLDER